MAGAIVQAALDVYGPLPRRPGADESSTRVAYALAAAVLYTVARRSGNADLASAYECLPAFTCYLEDGETGRVLELLRAAQAAVDR